MKKTVLLSVFFFVAVSLVSAQVNKETKKDLPIKEAAGVEQVQAVAKTASGSGTNSTQAVNVVTYDFTTGSDKYYGTTAAAKEVSTGVWAMIAGDANSDGTVNAIDFNDHWLPQNGTAYDYSKTGDFNLDGTINAIDYNNYWLVNNGKATQVPN